jgi:hypothetical protein
MSAEVSKHQQAPDPRKHLLVSLAKSLIRIWGFIALFYVPYVGCIILILAEVIGIAEELV